MSKDFVDYLNTLHRCGGNNESTTAEANQTSEYGKRIIVENSAVVDRMEQCVTQVGGKFILTGFAGDGKTTAALSLEKRLEEKGFHSYFCDREKTQVVFTHPDNSEFELIVVKDFSERNVKNDVAFINQNFLSPSKSLLLVSNTGTLLSFLESNAQVFGKNALEVEKDVLDAFQGDGDLTFGSISYHVLNLARQDNLALGAKVLNLMVDAQFWKDCENCPRKDACPIFRNVELLRYSEVRTRLFHIYRRLYEYGKRFTMRQLVEHFAYSITGSFSCAELLQRPKFNQQQVECFAFYNNMFGDHGSNDVSSFETKMDQEALQIAVVSTIRNAHIGTSIPAQAVRDVWYLKNQTLIDKQIYPDQYKQLVFWQNGNLYDMTKKDVWTRLHVYRFMYFFMNEKYEGFPAYVNEFLQSPGFNWWQEVQKSQGHVSTVTDATLYSQIVHVLKEYFAGVQLPDYSNDAERDIYITMSRRNKDIFQTAQTVLGKFTPDSLHLVYQLEKTTNLYQIVLNYKDKVSMSITLPFLDYLKKRKDGELADDALALYQRRLDAFKDGILQELRKDPTDSLNQNKVLLVKMDNNLQLSNVEFLISGEGDSQRIEVQ